MTNTETEVYISQVYTNPSHNSEVFYKRFKHELRYNWKFGQWIASFLCMLQHDRNSQIVTILLWFRVGNPFLSPNRANSFTNCYFPCVREIAVTTLCRVTRCKYYYQIYIYVSSGWWNPRCFIYISNDYVLLTYCLRIYGEKLIYYYWYFIIIIIIINNDNKNSTETATRTTTATAEAVTLWWYQCNDCLSEIKVSLYWVHPCFKLRPFRIL